MKEDARKISEFDSFINATPQMRELIVALQTPADEVVDKVKVDEALQSKRATVSKYSSVAGFMEFDPKTAAQSNRKSMVKNRRATWLTMSRI